MRTVKLISSDQLYFLCAYIKLSNSDKKSVGSVKVIVQLDRENAGQGGEKKPNHKCLGHKQPLKERNRKTFFLLESSLHSFFDTAHLYLPLKHLKLAIYQRRIRWMILCWILVNKNTVDKRHY